MNDTYLGTILAWAGIRVPSGFAWCDGRSIQIQTNPALYSVIGNKYGGDGISNFALPDLRCRVPLGMANSQPPMGSVKALGTQGGQESLTLTIANLPQHSHGATLSGQAVTVEVSLQASSNTGTTQLAQGNYLANASYPGGVDSQGNTLPSAVCSGFVSPAQAGDPKPLAGLSASASLSGAVVSVSTTGTGTPVGIQPMYTVINYIICTNGLYPNFD